MSIRMWFDIKCPSKTSHSLARTNYLNICARYLRNWLCIAFLQYLGIHASWYLHSHRLWFKLRMSFIENRSFVNLSRSPLEGFSFIPVHVKHRSVPRHSREFT